MKGIRFKHLLFFLLLIPTINIFGQNKQDTKQSAPTIVEKFNSIMQMADPSEMQMDTIYDVTRDYCRMNKDTCEILTKHALTITKNSKNQVLHGRALMLAGNPEVRNGRDSIGFANYFSAVEIFGEAKDTHLMSACNAEIGSLLMKKGEFKKSAEKLIYAIELARAINDSTLLAPPLGTLAGVYYYMESLDKADKTLDEAANLAEKFSNYISMSNILANKGSIALQRGEKYNLIADSDTVTNAQLYRDSANFYFKRALVDAERSHVVAKKINHIGLITHTAMAISTSMNALGMYKEAEEMCKQGLLIAEKTNNKSSVFQLKTQLGKAQLNQGLIKEALISSLSAYKMANELDRPNELLGINENLYAIYKNMGNYKEALNKLEEVTKYQLKERNLENNKAIAEIEVKYNTAEKERQLLQQEKDILSLKSNNAKVARQRNLVLAGALLLGIGFWAFRLRNQKKILEEEVAKRTAKIEQQSKELKQLDKMKSNFFANVSHELRTPLTLMLGPVDKILKDDNLNNQQFTLLKVMQQNGNDLLKLTNEILDLAKLESSKLTLHEKPVAIYPFLQRLVSVFETYSQRNNIDLSIELKANPNLQVSLDQKKFEKIVNNLLSNALKFTPAGGKVAVTLNDLGHSLQLEVTDTGQGIHPDDLSNIFNRFYQAPKRSANGETTSVEENRAGAGGTGIGLALVQEYAKLFNGKASVKSELQKGSTFTFVFPKKQVFKSLENADAQAIYDLEHGALPASENTHVSLVAPLPTTSSTSDKPTVLIVEDNYQLRDYIQFLLNDNHQVHTAENGKAALDWLDKQADTDLPDLIISDVMMPIMDGIQFLKKVKDTGKYCTIPVIMLTAKATLDDKISALRIGVDDYMVKPFVEDELVVRIENLLKNAIARKQFVAEEQTTETTTEQKEEPTPISQADLKWLSEIEALTLNHLSDFDFNLDRLSQLAFLSPRQVRRRLKQLTGLSFTLYLKEARFQEARRLLEEEGIASTKQLAYEVGMKDARYFKQQFKEHFGKGVEAYL